SYTKNHDEAEQPIPDHLVEIVRPWLASKRTGKPVFSPLSQKTGLMLAKDLERCGIKPVDDQGRVVDMHSLRHGYITTLAKAGVPLKTLQTLARHSDPKLTLNVYSHLTLIDTASALEALSDLSTKRPAPEAARMTGTDPVKAPISNRVSLPLPYKTDGTG